MRRPPQRADRPLFDLPAVVFSVLQGLVVLLIAASAAGAAYFTMAALTELPPEPEPSHNERGPVASATEPQPLAPRPRLVYLPHGFEQLIVTTASIALAALTGRYLFRIRL